MTRREAIIGWLAAFAALPFILAADLYRRRPVIGPVLDWVEERLVFGLDMTIVPLVLRARKEQP